MIITVDTREQKPLEFDNEYITETRKKALKVGDYGCIFKDGHVVPIYFERKSIPDLFGTMGKGYERFKKEIIRSHKEKVSLFLIIEGSLFKVLSGYDHSKLAGISVVRKLFTLWVRHGVMPVFCKNKHEMAEYITQFYIACGKDYIRRKKSENIVE